MFPGSFALDLTSRPRKRTNWSILWLPFDTAPGGMFHRCPHEMRGDSVRMPCIGEDYRQLATLVVRVHRILEGSIQRTERIPNGFCSTAIVVMNRNTSMPSSHARNLVARARAPRNRNSASNP